VVGGGSRNSFPFEKTQLPHCVSRPKKGPASSVSWCSMEWDVYAVGSEEGTGVTLWGDAGGGGQGTVVLSFTILHQHYDIAQIINMSSLSLNRKHYSSITKQYNLVNTHIQHTHTHTHTHTP
jgi:hypothetical protein